MRYSNEVTKEKILSLIASEFGSDACFEREMGLPQKTVNNWRRGRSASYMKMLPKLAESFDVSVGELLDVPIKHDTSELSDEELKLLTKFRKTADLSPKARAALIESLGVIMDMYIEANTELKPKKTRRAQKQMEK